MKGFLVRVLALVCIQWMCANIVLAGDYGKEEGRHHGKEEDHENSQESNSEKEHDKHSDQQDIWRQLKNYQEMDSSKVKTPCSISETGDKKSGTITEDGIKWFPGHYMRVAAIGQKEAVARQFLQNPYTQGLVLQVTWKQLEPKRDVYRFKHIDRFKELAERYGKKLSLKVMDRCFSKCTDASVPEYIDKELNGVEMLRRAKNNLNSPIKGSTARIWDPVIADRFIALYAALGKRYDQDLTISGVTIGSGESALAVSKKTGYTVEAHLAQLVRMAEEIKKHFPHTVVYTGINHLGSKDRYIRKLVKKVAEIGGSGIVHPDTIPVDFSKGSNFHHYLVEHEYRDHIAIFPQFQTVFITDDLSEEQIFKFAVNSLDANLVSWESGFYKRSAKYNRPDYLKKFVFPVVNKYKGAVNTACPSSFAKCITTCK